MDEKRVEDPFDYIKACAEPIRGLGAVWPPPAYIFQPLDLSVKEFVAGVKQLMLDFPSMDQNRAIEIALELKRLGTPREVK